MKKAVLAMVVVVVVAVWAAVVFRNDKTAAAREWPLGLGTLDSVPRRHPELDFNTPLPNLREPMKRSRELAARAIERGSWDDLHAAREISRKLWQRPELISAIVALAIDQEIVTAAKQMPRPLPRWFEELRTFDRRRAVVAAFQNDTWLIGAAIRDYAHSNDPGVSWVRRTADRTFVAPYVELSRADFLEHQRRVAVQMAKGDCTFDEPSWWNTTAKMAAPNRTAICQKLERLRADLDAIKP